MRILFVFLFLLLSAPLRSEDAPPPCPPRTWEALKKFIPQENIRADDIAIPLLWDRSEAPLLPENTGDTRGSVLHRCEERGHLPWSEMLEKYLDNPSNEAFRSAYKEKVADILKEFPVTLQSILGRENFERILALKDVEGIVSRVNEECESAPVTAEIVQGILIEEFKEAFDKTVIEQKEEMLSFRREMELCESLMGATKWTDFSNVENLDNRTAQSFDGRIQCRTLGNDTQDFPKCKSAVNFYNISAVSGEALNQIQNVRHQGKMMDGQRELIQGGPFNHTGALEYQKEGIKSMKGIAQQKAVFDGIKLAKFLQIVKTMPTYDSLHDSCVDRHETAKDVHKNMMVGLWQNYQHSIKSFFSGAEFIFDGPDAGVFEGASLQEDSSAEHICTRSISAERFLLRNQAARDMAKQIAIQAAVDLGVNLAQAHVLGKQIDDLDGIIQKVNEYDPSKSEFGKQARKLKECYFNPEAKGCGRPTAPGFQGLPVADTQFNIESGGTGQAEAEGGKEEEGATDGAENRTPNKQHFFDTVSRVPEGIDKRSGRPSTVAAAQLKPGGGAGGPPPGGGAGAAPPPGGGVGGPGAGPGRKGRKRGSSARPANVGKYKASGSGALAGFFKSKGGRRPGQKDEEEANPFSKLFKKKGPDNELDFPDIGEKEETIFDRISRRYRDMDGKGRLLKYEEEIEIKKSP